MGGKELKKDPEIEEKINKILKHRDARGLKPKFDDLYHRINSLNVRKTYWRRKLLEEKEKQPSGSEDNSRMGGKNE